MTETRVLKILEGERQLKNKTEIAKDLGVSTKTIQRDTKTPLYERLKNEFLDLYIEKMLSFMDSEKDTIALQSTIEMGRMLKAGIVKQVHSRTESAEIKIHLHEFKKPLKEIENE